MKKTLIILIVGLLLGGVSGYFYHAYKYKAVIEAGKNWQASQYVDTFVYKDLTNQVQITCNFGNKKTINAKNTDIKFTEKDFDADGKFIGHDKNFLIQKACGITEKEATDLLEQTVQGKNPPSLFNVKLISDPLGLFSNNPELEACLKQVNPSDPAGLGNETEAQKTQRQDCINKYSK
ncbi:MAG: hypothetical protein UX98_C0012G0040 [Parcubacteria group bacterium GW2011_GWA2_47_26]|nr:MAG: hypothetical protein UX98_C0012G0040 [Parcubacteria group bacterium GW2011_GWA2_47_26]